MDPSADPAFAPMGLTDSHDTQRDEYQEHPVHAPGLGAGRVHKKEKFQWLLPVMATASLGWGIEVLEDDYHAANLKKAGFSFGAVAAKLFGKKEKEEGDKKDGDKDKKDGEGEAAAAVTADGLPAGDIVELPGDEVPLQPQDGLPADAQDQDGQWEDLEEWQEAQEAEEAEDAKKKKGKGGLFSMFRNKKKEPDLEAQDGQLQDGQLQDDQFRDGDNLDPDAPLGEGEFADDQVAVDEHGNPLPLTDQQQQQQQQDGKDKKKGGWFASLFGSGKKDGQQGQGQDMNGEYGDRQQGGQNGKKGKKGGWFAGLFIGSAAKGPGGEGAYGDSAQGSGGGYDNNGGYSGDSAQGYGSNGGGQSGKPGFFSRLFGGGKKSRGRGAAGGGGFQDGQGGFQDGYGDAYQGDGGYSGDTSQGGGFAGDTGQGGGFAGDTSQGDGYHGDSGQGYAGGFDSEQGQGRRRGRDNRPGFFSRLFGGSKRRRQNGQGQGGYQDNYQDNYQGNTGNGQGGYPDNYSDNYQGGYQDNTQQPRKRGGFFSRLFGSHGSKRHNQQTNGANNSQPYGAEQGFNDGFTDNGYADNEYANDTNNTTGKSKKPGFWSRLFSSKKSKKRQNQNAYDPENQTDQSYPMETLAANNTIDEFGQPVVAKADKKKKKKKVFTWGFAIFTKGSDKKSKAKTDPNDPNDPVDLNNLSDANDVNDVNNEGSQATTTKDKKDKKPGFWARLFGRTRKSKSKTAKTPKSKSKSKSKTSKKWKWGKTSKSSKSTDNIELSNLSPNPNETPRVGRVRTGSPQLHQNEFTSSGDRQSSAAAIINEDDGFEEIPSSKAQRKKERKEAKAAAKAAKKERREKVRERVKGMGLFRHRLAGREKKEQKDKKKNGEVVDERFGNVSSQPAATANGKPGKANAANAAARGPAGMQGRKKIHYASIAQSSEGMYKHVNVPTILKTREERVDGDRKKGKNGKGKGKMGMQGQQGKQGKKRSQGAVVGAANPGNWFWMDVYWK